MSVARQTTVCPFCKESINATATRCRHCHSVLKPSRDVKKPLLANYNNFRVGFLSGVLFSLIIAVLFYLQFFSE